MAPLSDLRSPRRRQPRASGKSRGGSQPFRLTMAGSGQVFRGAAGNADPVAVNMEMPPTSHLGTPALVPGTRLDFAEECRIGTLTSKAKKLKFSSFRRHLAHSPPLRIIRSNQTWRVIESFTGVNHCLERLAYRKGYRVADVCTTLGCSSRYLHAMFVRDLGLPPKHWMKLERMVVARRKLEGGKSPEEVSSELGFMSIHTFCRQFREYYQTTPAKFQNDRQIFDPEKGLQEDSSGDDKKK